MIDDGFSHCLYWVGAAGTLFNEMFAKDLKINIAILHKFGDSRKKHGFLNKLEHFRCCEFTMCNESESPVEFLLV
jgi:hypothetical protein